MLHIPPISAKLENDLPTFVLFPFSLSPYCDHDAFTHLAKHVLDSPPGGNLMSREELMKDVMYVCMCAFAVIVYIAL